jgi:glycosyltransferase involved in cell wall biosynthesis
MPSESEGLSMSLLEAMVLGSPVIYSDIPENVEVADGCGLSFRNNDAGDLAEKMSHLLNQPHLAEELGEAGRERVRDEYDWEKVVDATNQVYSNLFM